MAIASYSDLQAAIANWLNRTDLTTRIVEFIALAEARLNRDVMLRTAEDNESLSTVIGSRFVAIPSRFSESMALFIERTSGRNEITFVRSIIDTSASSGEPQYWTIDGTNIAFERPADQVYTLTLKMLQTFSLTITDPNYLLTNYPDIYLAASLVEGFGYLMDDEALKWEARYQQILADVNFNENRSRSKATLMTDIPVSRQSRAFNINTGL